MKDLISYDKPKAKKFLDKVYGKKLMLPDFDSTVYFIATGIAESGHPMRDKWILTGTVHSPGNNDIQDIFALSISAHRWVLCYDWEEELSKL